MANVDIRENINIAHVIWKKYRNRFLDDHHLETSFFILSHLSHLASKGGRIRQASWEWSYSDRKVPDPPAPPISKRVFWLARCAGSPADFKAEIGIFYLCPEGAGQKRASLIFNWTDCVLFVIIFMKG